MKFDKQAIMTKQIQALESLSIDQLREKFQELYSFETDNINLQALKRRLAYRIQEIHLGGLTDTEEALLEQLADNDPLANMSKVPARKYGENIGTLYYREWHGQRHEVIYRGKDQYEYCGAFYKSLSAIAKLITGTKWNGKLFFGVK